MAEGKKKRKTYLTVLFRCLFAACAAYGGGALLKRLWTQVLLLLFPWQTGRPQNMAASIGVIGGADGPTAIFVTTRTGVHPMISLFLLVIGIWGFWKLGGCKRK